MSLERKDVRFKMAPEVHQALSVLAEISQVDIGEFCELLIQREVVRRVHEANVISDRTARLGITGKSQEQQGVIGK
jgi:hypothetical protein